MTTTELLLDAPDPHRSTDRYRLTLAADATDVQAARRLRHQVFSTEFGATTPGPDGLDTDEFDDVCDRLIVWHGASSAGDGGSGRRQAVATYRLLPRHSNDYTPRAGGLYASTEFDLASVEGLLDRTVEAGRSCGPAAEDCEFGTADFLVLLNLEQANQRYLRFFLGTEDGR